MLFRSRANRDLLALAEMLGEDTAQIQHWITVIEAGAQKLWNPDIGAYDALNIRTGNFAGSISSSSFLCWYAGIEDKWMLKTFDRISSSALHLMPSHDPQSERFEPFRYWRGPVWGIINTLLGIGLRDMGHTDRAEKLRRDTTALITQSGFAEYFNPEDGSPAGGMDFTWTAAIWLAWASPSAQLKGQK